jgi:hypothetical protein
LATIGRTGARERENIRLIFLLNKYLTFLIKIENQGCWKMQKGDLMTAKREPLRLVRIRRKLPRSDCKETRTQKPRKRLLTGGGSKSSLKNGKGCNWRTAGGSKHLTEKHSTSK